MQITRSSVATQKGPSDWFTGDVYIDAVAAPGGTSTFAAAAVHFTPGARTAWHTHPHGQTIFVTAGVGLCRPAGGGGGGAGGRGGAGGGGGGPPRPPARAPAFSPRPEKPPGTARRPTAS